MNKGIKYFFAGIILSGCSATPTVEPDLSELYGKTQTTNQPPVIFIHGVMGSEISDGSDKILWPGTTLKLLFGDYTPMALEVSPNSHEASIPKDQYVSGIVKTIAGKDLYGDLLNAIREGGYERSDIDNFTPTPQKRNYFIFTYDWRQDNVQSAKQLNEFIENIKRKYNEPDLKVDIVAHSMGGLITRYYLRYGAQDVVNDNHFDKKLDWSGSKNVRKAILLGTPNWGALNSIKLFIEGRQIGFNKISPETLLTMPSLTQLFPHPIVSEKSLITINGKELKRDLHDIYFWKRFQWSIFNPKLRAQIAERYNDPQEANKYIKVLERFFEKSLERSRRFAWSLSIKPQKPSPTNLIILGGDWVLSE